MHLKWVKKGLVGWMVLWTLWEVPCAESKEEVIVIESGSPNGPSKISELLGGMTPYPLPEDEKQADLIGQAWNEAGLKHLRGQTFFGNVVVTRQSNGDLALDFTDFDLLYAMPSGWLKLKIDQQLFSIWGTPPVLSSYPQEKQADQYSPANMQEWYSFVSKTVRHIAHDLKMPGNYYEVWNEPEDYGSYWKGKSKEESEQGGPGEETLAEFVKLYVTTAKAVKAADPTARVGGPGTAHWNAGPRGLGYYPWGLLEFLEALHTYRQEHPEERVFLDFISWHDYGWSKGKSLADGAVFVDELLARLKWPSKPEYLITEWNSEWGTCEHSLAYRASYAAYNLIQQSNPEQRRFSRLYWFDFNVNNSSDAEYPAGCKKLSVITERPSLCKRPLYAVFQLMRKMATGQYLRTRRPSGLPVEMVAVREGSRLMAAVNNHTTTVQKVTLLFQNLPFSARKAKIRLQQVDEKHSNNCQGLEEGTVQSVEVNQASVPVPVELPRHSTLLVTLEVAE